MSRNGFKRLIYSFYDEYWIFLLKILGMLMMQLTANKITLTFTSPLSP